MLHKLLAIGAMSLGPVAMSTTLNQTNAKFDFINTYINGIPNNPKPIASTEDVLNYVSGTYGGLNLTRNATPSGRDRLFKGFAPNNADLYLTGPFTGDNVNGAILPNGLVEQGLYASKITNGAMAGLNIWNFELDNGTKIKSTFSSTTFSPDSSKMYVLASVQGQSWANDLFLTDARGNKRSLYFVNNINGAVINPASVNGTGLGKTQTALLAFDTATMSLSNFQWLSVNSSTPNTFPGEIIADNNGVNVYGGFGAKGDWSACNGQNSMFKLTFDYNLNNLASCHVTPNLNFNSNFVSDAIELSTGEVILAQSIYSEGRMTATDVSNTYKTVVNPSATGTLSNTPAIWMGDKTNMTTKNGIIFPMGSHGLSGMASSKDISFVGMEVDKNEKYLYTVLNAVHTLDATNTGSKYEMVDDNSQDVLIMRYDVQAMRAGTAPDPDVIVIKEDGITTANSIILEPQTGDLIVAGSTNKLGLDFENVFEGKTATTELDTFIFRVNADNFKIHSKTGIWGSGYNYNPSLGVLGNEIEVSFAAQDIGLQGHVPQTGNKKTQVIHRLHSLGTIERLAKKGGLLRGYSFDQLIDGYTPKPRTIHGISNFLDVDGDGTLDSYQDYLVWRANKLFADGVARTAIAFNVPVESIKEQITNIQELENYISVMNAKNGTDFVIPKYTPELPTQPGQVVTTGINLALPIGMTAAAGLFIGLYFVMRNKKSEMEG